MEEACTSAAPYAGRLFYTVRNILMLYCQVVPTAHAHALATLPQQAGEFWKSNNYFFYYLFLYYSNLLRQRVIEVASLNFLYVYLDIF